MTEFVLLNLHWCSTHLLTLAQYLQVPDCQKSKTRLALLKAIVKSLALSDDASEHRLEAVLAKDPAPKSQEDMTDSSADLVECLLENVDLSDGRDFSSLMEKAESRSQVKKAKKKDEPVQGEAG